MSLEYELASEPLHISLKASRLGRCDRSFVQGSGFNLRFRVWGLLFGQRFEPQLLYRFTTRYDRFTTRYDQFTTLYDQFTTQHDHVTTQYDQFTKRYDHLTTRTCGFTLPKTDAVYKGTSLIRNFTPSRR